MKLYYTSEKNVQILISLLKAHNIRKIIASPGTCNENFVGSIQKDSFFQIYSCVDERSACYMACGLAEESGEAVVLSCTGATASRNYVPGLTEAFYRKLPILAVTSGIHQANIGNNIPQSIDRTKTLSDIVKLSVQVPTINCSDDKWQCEIAINKAILELTHNGGGPVHINLIGINGSGFGSKSIPKSRKIERITLGNNFPNLNQKKVGIFIGAHKKINNILSTEIEMFCEKNNAVVLCDHTSNYNGKYKIIANIVCNQESYSTELNNFDILLHIGNISGSYMKIRTKEVWRINPDGELRDTFRKLRYVFEMDELLFFKKYNQIKKNDIKKTDFYDKWKKEFDDLENKAMKCELPFSNIWIARTMITRLHDESTIHLAILNTLRSWNFFDSGKKLFAYTNTGGFGIDGGMSSLIGSSLVNENKIYYGVIGDLSFFYDLNSLGNRNIKNNIRLLLINNGGGTEFHIHLNPGYQFGEDVGKYMAADGHFGNKSKELVKHYAQDLGFEYMSANTKDDFLSKIDYFIKSENQPKSIIFEVFTESENEEEALKIITNLKISISGSTKKTVKKMLSPNVKNKLKRIVNN